MAAGAWTAGAGNSALMIARDYSTPGGKGRTEYMEGKIAEAAAQSTGAATS